MINFKKQVTYYSGVKDVVGEVKDLDTVLLMIKNGSEGLDNKVSYLRTLKGEKYNEYKRNYLPLFCGSGYFSYRNSDPNNLIEYNNIIILDFDWPEETPKDFLQRCKDELISKADGYHVYAVWFSPGHGIKCAFLHNNQDPSNHYNMLQKIKRDVFANAPLDMKCGDVCRGCFMSYDPELFINTSPYLQPYNYQYDSRLPYTTPQSSDTSTYTPGKFVHTQEDIKKNLEWQRICPDKKLMNTLIKTFNYHTPDYYVDGQRHKEVMRRAVIYCKDGILYENAVWSLVGQFGERSWAGLKDYDVESMVSSCYKKAVGEFGSERQTFLQKHYSNKLSKLQ